MKRNERGELGGSMRETDRTGRGWRCSRVRGACVGSAVGVAGANQPVARVGMRSFGELIASSAGIRRCMRIGVMTRGAACRCLLAPSAAAIQRGVQASAKHAAEHVWLLRSNICRHMTNNYPCAKIRPPFGSPTATASAARSDRKKLLVSVPNANVCRETGCATRPIPSVPPKHMQPDEGTATMSIPMLRARRNAHKHAHALPQLAHPRAPIVAVMRSRPRMQRRAAARCVCGGRVDRPRAPVRASNPRSDVSP